MLDCEICGNEFDEGICMDCEVDLRAVASRTPLELAAGDLLDACNSAKRFIRNGIGFGYIKMPDEKTDPAYETLPQIETAIAKAQDNPSPQANLSAQDEHKFAP
jgi:hypothetical protein